MIPLSSNVTLYSSSKQLAHFIHGSTFSPVFFFLGNPIRWCNITHYSCVIQPKSIHHQASNLQSFQRRTRPLAHESMAYHNTLIRDREKQIQGWTWQGMRLHYNGCFRMEIWNNSSTFSNVMNNRHFHTPENILQACIAHIYSYPSHS